MREERESKGELKQKSGAKIMVVDGETNDVKERESILEKILHGAVS